MKTEQWERETVVSRYRSMALYGATVARMASEAGERGHSETSFLGRPLPDAVRACSTGDTEHQQPITDLVDRIQADLPLKQGKRGWTTDIVGYIPHVPNGIMGLPNRMMRPKRRRTNRAPARILVNVVISAGVHTHQIVARGAACAALAMAVQRTRPVELCMLATLMESGQPTHIIEVSLGTSPLHPAMVAYALCDNAVARRLPFLHGNNGINGPSTLWPWNLGRDRDEMERRIRHCLRLAPSDVYIHGGHLLDEMTYRPLDFITRELARIAPEQLH